MTDKQFSQRAMNCAERLHRISYLILGREADCEDAVQEALLRGWEKRNTLRNEAYFQTWLIRILINECYSILRRRKRETLYADIPEREVAMDACPNLYQLFTSLREAYRLPMVLHYVEGYTAEEIAGILHLPRNTVKSRLYRGKLLLRDALEEEDIRL